MVKRECYLLFRTTFFHFLFWYFEWIKAKEFRTLGYNALNGYFESFHASSALAIPHFNFLVVGSRKHVHIFFRDARCADDVLMTFEGEHAAFIRGVPFLQRAVPTGGVQYRIILAQSHLVDPVRMTFKRAVAFSSGNLKTISFPIKVLYTQINTYMMQFLR